MKRAQKLVLLTGNIDLNLTCPVITPAVEGNELLANGTFAAWTGDNPNSWTVSGEDAAHYVTESAGKARLHGDDGATSFNVGQFPSLALGSWFLSTFDLTVNTLGARVTFPSSTFATAFNIGASAAKTYAGRVTAASGFGVQFFRRSDGAWEYDLDNVSIKKLTFSTMLARLGNIHRQTGTYVCTPSVATDAIAGLAICYKDASNFVLIQVDRVYGKAYLTTCTGGTYAVSATATGNITYGDGKQLKAIVQADGTTALYYDGAQVGTNHSLTLSNFGTEVYGFSTNADSLVGRVATSPSANFL